MNNGVSLAIIHNEKGAEILSKISSELTIQNINKEFVVKYNPSIISSACLSPARRVFFEKINNGVLLEDAINESLAVKKPPKTSRIKWLLNLIK